MMAKRKLIIFWLRLLLVCGIAAGYLTASDFLQAALHTSLRDGIHLSHIVWLATMAGMCSHWVPTRHIGRSGNKQFRGRFPPGLPSDHTARLRERVREMDRGAAKVLVLWLSIVAAVALLYWTGWVTAGEVLLVSALFYLGDIVCMTFWCPLQALFMDNRCCVDCRIYGWGYLLITGPLLLIPSFYTYSLAAMAMFLFIRWEILYRLHPERFWEGSNRAIRCGDCVEQGCAYKRKLAAAVGRSAVKESAKL